MVINGDVETNDHDDNDFNENQNLVYIAGDIKHVRLITNNKSTKDYVTCIISVTEELTVTFLRSSGACKRKFVYPINHRGPVSDHHKISNISRTKSRTLPILVSACSCLSTLYWSQALSGEWRCSWSSAERRCSKYIWVINNFIAY